MDYMSNRLKYDLINPHGFHELMIGTVYELCLVFINFMNNEKTIHTIHEHQKH